VTQPVDQGIAQDNMAHDHHDQTDGVLARVPLLGSVIHYFDLQTDRRVVAGPL
jgi:hypothetical protein